MIIIEMKADAMTAELLKIALAFMANSIERSLGDTDDLSDDDREKLEETLRRVNYIGNDLHNTLNDAYAKEREVSESREQRQAAFLQGNDTIN